MSKPLPRLELPPHLREREADLIRATLWYPLSTLAGTTKLDETWLLAWFRQRGVHFNQHGSRVFPGGDGRQRARIPAKGEGPSET